MCSYINARSGYTSTSDRLDGAVHQYRHPCSHPFQKADQRQVRRRHHPQYHPSEGDAHERYYHHRPYHSGHQLHKRRVDLKAVRANIERLKIEYPEGSVIIQADQRSRSGLLVEAMDQIRLAGVTNISIAAKNDN